MIQLPQVKLDITIAQELGGRGLKENGTNQKKKQVMKITIHPPSQDTATQV
jgi:hypothetical protein